MRTRTNRLRTAGLFDRNKSLIYIRAYTHTHTHCSTLLNGELFSSIVTDLRRACDNKEELKKKKEGIKKKGRKKNGTGPIVSKAFSFDGI